MDWQELQKQKRGRLTVVGTGIREEHITLQALTAIQRATKLLHFSHVDGGWVRKFNANAENLAIHRGLKKDRRESYFDMVEHILAHVRAGDRWCSQSTATRVSLFFRHGNL